MDGFLFEQIDSMTNPFVSPVFDYLSEAIRDPRFRVQRRFREDQDFHMASFDLWPFFSDRVQFFLGLFVSSSAY